MGEFGATIMFAGSLQGVTQTAPIATYLLFEQGDFGTALALGALADRYQRRGAPDGQADRAREDASLRAHVTYPLRDFTVDVALDVAVPTALVGPSGAGKSTILRLIAGLRTPASGEISCNGEIWFGPGVNVPVERRRVGFVFQDYALFPHRSVIGNVAFEARRDPDEMLRQLGIEHLAHARPRNLSGGERQRVALARALATEPQLLLLDEPLAALDPGTRGSVAAELAAILQRTQIPVITVTHSYEEATTLAEQVDRHRPRPHRPVGHRRGAAALARRAGSWPTSPG